MIYGDFLKWNQLDENTRIIAVTYYADHCVNCKSLAHKMRRIKWVFARKPVIFIDYDKSNLHKRTYSRKKLENIHMLTPALKNEGLAYTALFDYASKKLLLKLNYDETAEEMEHKIRLLLSEYSN